MEWQPIKSHLGLYEVSSCGQVRNLTKGFVLKQWLNDQGYPYVRLSKPRVMARVHRLVAEAFLPNPKSLPFVNHIDCVRSNNKIENLEWCTQAENLYHATKLGRMPRNYWVGKRSKNALLSDETVAEIRKKYQQGGISWSELGKEFGASKRTIGRIIRRETYV